jgi:2-polyprenyl-6-methoxyphenol hydroxylase-like FAD-dependent oxidoreductase
MGLLDKVMKQGYHQKEVRFVGDDNSRVGGFPTGILHELSDGRFTTIRRGALVEMFFEALNSEVESIFGDQITKLTEGADSISVALQHGGEREFDLLIGADGLHSAVRGLSFGPEAQFETYLGYAVAAFEVAGYRPRDEDIYVIHPAASRQVARFALRDDRTLFLFIFSCNPDRANVRMTIPEVRELVREEFRDVGWETQNILAMMEGVDDIYFDRMSQIRMSSWHKGRVALVGDAAAAVSLLAGEGTGLALVETYILAGEIARAGSDYGRAFDAYEERLRPFLKRKQEMSARSGSTFVPSTEFGVWVRNQATKLIGIPGIASLFLGRHLRDDLDLPAYNDLASETRDSWAS